MPSSSRRRQAGAPSQFSPSPCSRSTASSRDWTYTRRGWPGVEVWRCGGAYLRGAIWPGVEVWRCGGVEWTGSMPEGCCTPLSLLRPHSLWFLLHVKEGNSSHSYPSSPSPFSTSSSHQVPAACRRGLLLQPVPLLNARGRRAAHPARSAHPGEGRMLKGEGGGGLSHSLTAGQSGPLCAPCTWCSPR